MTAQTTPPGVPLQGQAPKPSLRCPGCAFMVPLPAETCPRCNTNLRTGVLSAESCDSDSSGRMKIIVGGGIFVVIIVLAVVFFGGFFDKPEPAAPPAPPVAQDNSDFGEALDAFHGLSDHSIGQQPAIILDRSRSTADKVDEKRQLQDDMFKEIQ